MKFFKGNHNHNSRVISRANKITLRTEVYDKSIGVFFRNFCKHSKNCFSYFCVVFNQIDIMTGFFNSKIFATFKNFILKKSSCYQLGKIFKFLFIFKKNNLIPNKFFIGVILKVCK